MQTEETSGATPDDRSGGGGTRESTQAGKLVDKAAREAGELVGEAREQVEDAAEDLLDNIADQLEDLADQLRRQDLASLFEHVRATAERSPGLYFAGSVATGLALARFVKSSAQRREPEPEPRSGSGSARQPSLTPPPSARSLTSQPGSPEEVSE